MQLEITSPFTHSVNLEQNALGYWQGIVKDAVPGMRYRFKPDNKSPLPDPASLSQPDGVHGASAVADRNSYEWSDDSWKGLELSSMQIYELHTGTFTPEGTFDGIIHKLDYLADLGINTIEIMPVAQFPGVRNWGYDGVFAFAVQHSYGGMDGLKRLVDAAHRKGIAVILDVVYNHLGPEGNYLPEFGPYNTDKYFTPWAKAMNFDDQYSDGVREYYLQNALMWLNDFHIDGLRLDAVHAIWDSGATHFLEVLEQRVRQLEEETGRKKVLIAEFDLNNPRYINPVSKGGYGMDGQWIDEFHHALHALITGETNGYYSDFGSIDDLEKSFRDSYVFTGQYSAHRKKKFGRKTDNDFGQFVVFAQNHDHTGNRMNGERLTTIMREVLKSQQPEADQVEQLHIEALKLIAATYILSPYVPMLFMGEEYGEENPFLFFTDHSDQELINNTSKGRKKEFESFAWKQDPPEPNDPETFKKSSLSWNIHSEHQKELLEFYKFLLRFRKSYPAFQSLKRKDLVVHPNNGSIICVERRNNDASALMLLNFSLEEQAYTLNGFSRRKIFNSSGPDWNDPKDQDTLIHETFILSPLSVTIFER